MHPSHEINYRRQHLDLLFFEIITLVVAVVAVVGVAAAV
jgi:hypothetical protein